MHSQGSESSQDEKQHIRLMKANCAASGKRNAQGSPPSIVRFQAPNGQALQPGQGRVTAWLRSKTEVCSSARRSGRGREEMTSQKGVVTAPGRRPGTSVLGGGAQRGRGVGALMDPLHPSGGQRGRRGGRGPPFGPPPLRAARGARWLRRASSPGLPPDPEGLQTDRPAHGGVGCAGPAGGDFPSRGPERVECKGGLNCEAGRTRRKPPRPRAHVCVYT